MERVIDDYFNDKHGIRPVEPIYIINSGFLFVCRSRTIFGSKKGAHVQIEGEKHDNKNTGLNMVCRQ